jgi:tRNA nucleotidyltransferase (CCA-adding enzyme)
MRLYEVGGAVRDALLGLPATDRDWVAVGASPETLAALGYRPVGRDFPVFLHPQTHEEVALARTERKTAPGYHGFVFHADANVTLEEDLARRDLTINAMARDEAGGLIDPFGGEKDLRAGVLRHVSPAFAEDPVRLLRVARFAARFASFSVAPETMALLRQMVAAGEVDALVPERVWQELSRGLMEHTPSRLCQVLHDSGAWPRLLPELQHAELPQRMQVLDASAAAKAPLTVRFAVLARPAADPAALAQRLRAPKDCEALAVLLTRELSALTGTQPTTANQTVALLERCDAWRRPQRFEELLLAAQLECPGQIDTAHWQQALHAAAGIDTAQAAAAAAQAGARGPAIGAAVLAARVKAVAQEHSA